MRHNARITIISDEPDGRRELDLFLSSFASPSELKVISRKAIRKMRRHFDSERFYINLIKLAQGTVNIFPIAATYLWQYQFNFTGRIPKLTITHTTNDLSRTVGLYRWLGPERPIKELPEEAAAIYGKRPRGRPSNIRRAIAPVPAPLYVTPEGVAVFEDDQRNAVARKNQNK